MPATKGPIWEYFLAGEKQNGSHLRAHCCGCVEKHRPDGAIIELDDEGNTKLSSVSWVVEGMTLLTVYLVLLTLMCI